MPYSQTYILNLNNKFLRSNIQKEEKCAFCNKDYGSGKYCEHYHSGTPTPMHPAHDVKSFTELINLQSKFNKSSSMNLKNYTNYFVALFIVIIMIILITS